MTVKRQNNTNRIKMALNALWGQRRWNRVARLENTCNDKSSDKTNRKNYSLKRNLNITKQSN
jgi:hypothetical protein